MEGGAKGTGTLALFEPVYLSPWLPLALPESEEGISVFLSNTIMCRAEGPVPAAHLRIKDGGG